MLNKGKKAEPKEESKEHPQVTAALVRPETPRLLRAALEVTERSSGLKGALAKVKEKTNKPSISSQVKKPKINTRKYRHVTPHPPFILSQPSISFSLPPPSPSCSCGPDSDVETPSPTFASSLSFRSASGCHNNDTLAPLSASRWKTPNGCTLQI